MQHRVVFVVLLANGWTRYTTSSRGYFEANLRGCPVRDTGWCNSMLGWSRWKFDEWLLCWWVTFCWYNCCIRYVMTDAKYRDRGAWGYFWTSLCPDEVIFTLQIVWPRVNKVPWVVSVLGADTERLSPSSSSSSDDGPDAKWWVAWFSTDLWTSWSKTYVMLTFMHLPPLSQYITCIYKRLMTRNFT